MDLKKKKTKKKEKKNQGLFWQVLTSLPNSKRLYMSELKAFADDKSKTAQMKLSLTELKTL